MQLFSATMEDATPAKSFASQTTPQWVRNDALSPRAAPADADMSDTADPGKDGPAWALQMNTGHEVRLRVESALFLCIADPTDCLLVDACQSTISARKKEFLVGSEFNVVAGFYARSAGQI